MKYQNKTKIYSSNILREFIPESDKKDFEIIFSNIVNKTLINNIEKTNTLFEILYQSYTKQNISILNLIHKSLVTNQINIEYINNKANFTINKDYYKKILKILNSLNDYKNNVPQLDESITKILNDILINIPTDYYLELLDLEDSKQ